MFDMSNKEDTTDVYKKSFDEKDYEAINKNLRNEYGIDLKQLKRKNFRSLKMLLNPSKKKSDDYPTFLDGYLMNIAMKKGKTIIGLEGISDHERALNALSIE